MRTRLYTFCVVSQTVYNAIFVLQPHLISSWHSFEASSQSDQCDLICASNMFHLHLMGYCSACTVQICDYWKVARLAYWIKAFFWWWYTVNCSLLNHHHFDEVKINGQKLRDLRYADDTALLSTTDTGLKLLVEATK